MLAAWLNPAVLLDGTTLGYLDPQMAVPLVVAAVLAWRRRPVWAGLWLAVAVLTKAQGVFAAPVVLALLAWRDAPPRWRMTGLAASGAAPVAALALLPFVQRGAWANLTQALGRLATHDMLSAQAANVWWIFTWVLRVLDAGPVWGWWRAWTQQVRILGISRAIALGYPNARVVGLAAVAVAIAWACWRARRCRTLADASALAAWSMYAYALLAAQVHENHLAPAIWLLVPAAALDRRYRGIFWALSAVVGLNLYLFYGLGTGWPPLVSRTVTGIDATVWLALFNVGTFVWFTWRLAHGTAPDAGVPFSPSRSPAGGPPAGSHANVSTNVSSRLSAWCNAPAGTTSTSPSRIVTSVPATCTRTAPCST